MTASATTPHSTPDSTPRGRLKIFFGMCPGVGKTYAMLAAAQRLAAQGVDVVAGIVETHGRAETEQILLGLDILPRTAIPYERDGVSTTLHEFDVDAAIRRHPDILLVDELAHSNAPGAPSGRDKRWQDVEACLAAGLNVCTTLNVQHLESLNDVIAQITGVRVNETVPDRIFEEADEIELVDLPPDALHERLRAGKVYLGHNADRAVDPSSGFFRKGNLTALRELALRRTAAWVDSEMRRYKADRGIRAIWPAGERIVVAVSPSPTSGTLVRAAKRMAAGLHADLLAVYVETTRTAKLAPADRERLHANLRLAESLGATTHTIVGDTAARELLAFARSRNVGRVVVGKTERPRWRDALFGSFIDTLIRESREIDIYVVTGDDSAPLPRRSPTPTTADTPTPVSLWQIAQSSALTSVVIAACSSIAYLCYRPPDLSEEALLLLGGVVLSALWLGRLAAFVASVLAVLSFNYLFTEPRFTLSVNDPGHLLTFVVMLAVGSVVGTLAARSRENMLRAWARERSTSSQYTLARRLAAARDVAEVASVVASHVHDLLHGDVIFCRPAQPSRTTPDQPSPHPRLIVAAAAGAPDWFEGPDDPQQREHGVAQWTFDHGRPAGAGTATLPSATGTFIPLIGSGGKLGVLGVRSSQAAPLAADDLAALEALAAQAASALERVLLAESEQAARFTAERERLRNALLSSVSHDLRTPLAGITGAATALEQPDTIDPNTRAALLTTIVQESSRLNDIIANLVFATRLESGAIDLRKEWTTVEEIVGVGLARHRGALASRPFRVLLPDSLPMIRVDNAMLPQVVQNLIENALRYTPPGTPMGVSATSNEHTVVIRVWDEGPGLAEDEASKVFERFYRGRASKPAVAPHAASGMGLGLTISEGIVRAHNGRIWAEPNLPRGVSFLFSLPIERPQPQLPTEPAGDALPPPSTPGAP